MVFEAVLPLFNPEARMTICGLIAHYGDAPGVDPRAQERDRAEARGVHVRNLSVGEYVADWHDAFFWPRWHSGSLLARSATARIYARD